MKNRLATLVGALALSAAASAQTWIWYPGDYEIWLGNQMNNRRTERGAFFPPFWKTDSHYVVVEFSKKLDLAEPEEIFIALCRSACFQEDVWHRIHKKGLFW